MRYLIEYQTTLFFDQPVFEQAVEIRVLPRKESYQTVISAQLEIEPSVEVFDYTDAHGNRVHHFNIIPPHERLHFRFRSEVENHLSNPFDFIPMEPEAERIWIENALHEDPRLNDYLLSISETTPPLHMFSKDWDWPRYDLKSSLLEAVQSAMSWLCGHFTYLPGTTSVHAPFREVLDKRAGVCQDFAHLLIAVVRSWGFPARYVMGYQYLESTQSVTPATHAWVEVLLPGRGWQGFDASQHLLANHSYIPVAVGRDSQDAAPQRGCFKGGARGREPQVEVKVSGQQ